MLQPAGDAMATGEVIITAQLMATGEAEVQSVQTTYDVGIAALLVCRLGSLSLAFFNICCLRVGP